MTKGPHELAAQQQFLNELSQTDRSERVRLPRPLLPQLHQVLKVFFEQNFDERNALKDSMNAATEPKLLSVLHIKEARFHPKCSSYSMLSSSYCSRRPELTTRLGPEGFLSDSPNQQQETARSSVTTVPVTPSERLCFCKSCSNGELDPGFTLLHQCPVLSLAEFGCVISRADPSLSILLRGRL
jgi:hypothetical protein